MKVHNKKIYSLIFIVLLLVLGGGPIYMYFSDNVELLNDQYPHKIIGQNSIDYEIRPGRPKDWVVLEKISSVAKWAIIISEDWSFYEHHGVDVEQMKVAVNEMMEGIRYRGASTITQQMVKNVYLSHSRNVWRKVHEIILAHKVEKALSKKKILEVYLNSIEFGPQVYGIKTASRHYFKKHPSEINAREAAFLAMLLPSPKKYSRSFREKRLTPYARQRVKVILNKMKVRKIISEDEYQTFLITPMSWENL